MKKYHIGIEATMDVISGKWKPLLLCYIQVGTNRNNEFLRAIPELSQKVLSEQLKQLEQDGIIKRTSYPEVPPRVEYSLTQYGTTLTRILMELCHWGEKHVQRLAQSDNPVELEQTLTSQNN